MMQEQKFIATSPREICPLLVEELQAMGLKNVEQKRNGAHFSGTFKDAYRVCLWSRLANKVWFALAQFECQNQDALYEGLQKIAWLTHMEAGGTLAIDAYSSRSKLDHTHFISQKSKDAIVDQIREKTGQRPSIDTREPDLKVRVEIDRDEATVGIDLAGNSLHRRGYRIEGAEAPLKETLAAALLWRSKWPEIAQSGGALYDPMCGSATLLIEGAMMAHDIAPNLSRRYFGFLRWKGHDPKAWEQLLTEAEARKIEGLKREVLIRGADQDGRIINIAERNMARTDFCDKITVKQQPIDDFRGLNPCPKEGLVIVNPPYGERLSTTPELHELYARLGRQLKKHFVGWHASIITSEPALARSMGLRAHKRNVLYNGTLKCEQLIFAVDTERQLKETRAHVVATETARELSEGATMVANRIRKNIKSLRKWQKKEDITCYRLYDRDIPEYAAAIDWYDGHLHIQEYAAPNTVDSRKAEHRFNDIVQAASRVMYETLQADPKNIHIKQRERQRGTSQYEKHDSRSNFFNVRENGCQFKVNLTDYLDTGLFLDHRITRNILRELSNGKSFLNLFAYTGTATVYAAKGGARSTTTVDMSNTYLKWAQENAELNHIGGRDHSFERADCLRWIRECRKQYGLIFLDPPTFSNSSHMSETFDVQRDHTALLQATTKLLAKNGTLIFSNNRRNFKMDHEALTGLDIKDITQKTIPPDFARNDKIHNVWEITRRKPKRIQMQ
ncbi:MAG: bifunctional 23S rRNA (guanine(2069)-N(7))-methyltransferase RlmK/23S rRNA (guanine(2445)-N(2))-methyltransferase RlmL [Myxococcota bacterium]|nr:bifunctional 23S rRNA (guanine(2069)-N(7))-methyltransferase RlmK/23S rRNA (guanine(2445)-N(2))-methyltransferase RlmL [Myxococcota bacterium]